MKHRYNFFLLLAACLLLVPSVAGAQDKEELVRPDGGTTTRLANTAAISTIDPEELAKYPDFNVLNALQGMAPGLIVRSNSSGSWGYTASDVYVRGQHGHNPSTAVVIIDGMVRSLDDIMVEEIGTIQVLKDASAKILFGPRASDGAILITTKRGEANKRVIKVNAEFGVSPITRDPQYLGAAEYAKLYNEARVNDGYPAYFTDEAIAGYKSSKGPFDQKYPSINWKEYFTRKMGTFRKATIDVSGGNKYAQYALLVGYTGGSSNEKVSSASQLHRFNVRGNLDIKITDFLKVKADVAARIESTKWGSYITSSALYTHMTTARPMEYSFTLNPETLGMEADESGIPFFGGSDLFAQNLYADVAYGGSYDQHYTNSQSDLGLDFDFGKLGVQGLKAQAYITFDNYSQVNESLNAYYPTYYIDRYMDITGAEATRVVNTRLVNRPDNITASQTTRRYLSVRGDASYERSFGRHGFSAVAAYTYAKDEWTGAYQDVLTSNGTLRLNYSFGGKYFVEAVAGFAGTNALAKANRYLFTPAVSLGWVISEESFLKNVSWVDFLKIKGSAGRLGVMIPNTSESAYLRYHTWYNVLTFKTGQTNSVNNYYMLLGAPGNPDLKWTTQTEYSAGVEGFFLGRRLSLEANVFQETRDGENAQAESDLSTAIGQWTPYTNYYKVRNRGVEVGLGWTDRSADGAFRYSLGLNFTAVKNKYLKYDEVDTDAYRMYVGQPTSVEFGLLSEGLFGKDVALDGHAVQTFGPYTTGDLAYKDLNSDGKIDTRDETVIGQSFPLTAWGFTADFNYKGFGLYAHLTAETGASAYINNSYFWNYKAQGYSVLARDRWHPVNNPGGTMPRLTSYADPNTYRKSSFWMQKQDFLRLKDVELSYTLQPKAESALVKRCKFFVRGTNLCVLSAIKGVDPEAYDAGVLNYPYYATITGGVNLTF